MIYSYYLDCNIQCKINYYKYENYHDKKKEPKPQNLHQVMTNDNRHYHNLKNDSIADLTNEKNIIENYDLPLNNSKKEYKDDDYINNLFNELYS